MWYWFASLLFPHFLCVILLMSLCWSFWLRGQSGKPITCLPISIRKGLSFYMCLSLQNLIIWTTCTKIIFIWCVLVCHCLFNAFTSDTFLLSNPITQTTAIQNLLCVPTIHLSYKKNFIPCQNLYNSQFINLIYYISVLCMYSTFVVANLE